MRFLSLPNVDVDLARGPHPSVRPAFSGQSNLIDTVIECPSADVSSPFEDCCAVSAPDSTAVLASPDDPEPDNAELDDADPDDAEADDAEPDEAEVLLVSP